MERDFCTKCGECCKKIPVDFERRIIYFDGIQVLDENFESMLKPVDKKENLILCECRFLKNNLCTNPNKPEICKNYPSSPFAFLPEECGYQGDIFIKYEKIKQKIRKLKEEILHYEALIKTTRIKSEQAQYEKIIRSHNSYIERYSVYGVQNW